MLKQMKLAGSAGALALAVMIAPAMGASSIPSSAPEAGEAVFSAKMFKAMDRNRDNMVSRDEYLAYMGRQYDKMDQGKKKMLNMTQFTDRKMMAQLFIDD